MKLKFLNLSVPRPTKAETDTSKRIIKYGASNDYPLEVLRSVNNSPTAAACLSTYARFLSGDGFTDTALSSTRANKDQTFDDVLNAICETETYFKGFALNVKYNMEGKIREVYPIPFEACRLSEPESGEVKTIRFNMNYGKRDYKEDQTEIYHLFDPLKVMEQIEAEGVKYKGQIIYKRQLKPGEYFYPIKFSESDIRVFETETGIINFNKSNIDSNFYLGALINIIGDPDEQVEVGRDSNNEPIYKRAEEVFDEMISQGLTGAENAGRAMVLWGKDKESMAKIEAFPTNPLDKIYETLRNDIIDIIARITKVPTILANIQVAGKLGAANEIDHATQTMNNVVLAEQNQINSVFKTILANWHEPSAAVPQIKPLTILKSVTPN